MTLAFNNLQAVRVNNGTAPVDIGVVRERTAAGLKVVWADAGPLSVTVDNVAPSGARAASGTVSVPTSIVTITITGGVGPYSISWARIDSGTPAWSISAPTGTATRFSVDLAAGDNDTAEFAATITDAASTVVTSDTVYAFAENFGGYL